MWYIVSVRSSDHSNRFNQCVHFGWICVVSSLSSMSPAVCLPIILNTIHWIQNKLSFNMFNTLKLYLIKSDYVYSPLGENVFLFNIIILTTYLGILWCIHIAMEITANENEKNSWLWEYESFRTTVVSVAYLYTEITMWPCYTRVHPGSLGVLESTKRVPSLTICSLNTPPTSSSVTRREARLNSQLDRIANWSQMVQNGYPHSKVVRLNKLCPSWKLLWIWSRVILTGIYTGFRHP